MKNSSVKELEVQEDKSCEGCISEFSSEGRCESNCYDCPRLYPDQYPPKATKWA